MGSPLEPQMSPYLYQFLMNQTANKQKKTTSGLLPGKVKTGIFNGLPTPSASLDGIANSLASTRSNADAMYGIKLQKKQATEAQAAYDKQQKALAAKLLAIQKANKAAQDKARKTANANNGVPNPPPGPLPTPNNNDDGKFVLPPIVGESPADKKNREMNQWACDTYGQCPPGYSRRTTITEDKSKESLLDKLKGLFGQ